MTYTDLFFRAYGRFSRSQYWTGLAMCAFLDVANDCQFQLLAQAMPKRGFDGLAWLAPLLSPVLIAYIAFLLATVHVRRLHDLGQSGILVLVGLLPIVGVGFVVAICGFGRGQAGANRYGPDPLFNQNDAAGIFDLPPRPRVS